VSLNIKMSDLASNIMLVKSVRIISAITPAWPYNLPSLAVPEDRGIKELLRQGNVFRQEEIIEEIEVILLSAVSLDEQSFQG